MRIIIILILAFILMGYLKYEVCTWCRLDYKSIDSPLNRIEEREELLILELRELNKSIKIISEKL